MDWSHIEWKNDDIPASIAKKAALASPARQDRTRAATALGGPLPSQWTILPGANTATLSRWTVNPRRKPMLEAVGLPDWPNNTLRHTYKSYHEAIHDHALTQDQMGHSNPNMTRYGYGTDTAGGIFITKELAEEWFAL